MRIDAHHFFWKYKSGQFTDKPQGQFDVLKNDHLPHDLLVSLVNNDIEGSIAVQNSRSDKETNFLLRLSEENDFVRGVIGWIDLENPNIGQKINYYNKSRVVSFRESFALYDDPYFAVRPEVIRGIELIQEYKYPLDIQCRADQFPAVIDLIHTMPDQKFVLNDMGFLPHSPNSLESWKRLMPAIASFPNVFCKINGLFMMQKIIGMNDEKIAFCLHHIENLFGAQRMIYGSDWPYCKVAFNYKEQIKWVEEVFESLSQDEMDHIFGGTARKVYFD
ncbi:amidohydrolase family protein [Membranicola marinus]|uniref:Amidohydrolase family protein n=1 Tax=Membranihabitans marinus TaxID=1227546 RepID=A0A953LA66_9BACT|nr:amidohydrolase family protein [Membranihabitans marinus]MBY5957311.1 amidohydrolase family protein [Membranihabitans marinus]